MRLALAAAISAIVALSGCAESPSIPPGSETVLITYHVIPGKEADLEAILREAWMVYQNERLVVPGRHVVALGQEADGKPRLTELFTWVDHSAPDHASNDVKQIWAKMQSCVEARDGHPGIDGGEVSLVGQV